MRRRTPAPADSAPSPAVWPKVACGGLLLAVAVALAGCSSGHSLKAATAHGRSPGASASGQPSGGPTAAAAPASAAGTQSAVPWPSGTLAATPAAP
jgi:hypothetical protein